MLPCHKHDLLNGLSSLSGISRQVPGKLGVDIMCQVKRISKALKEIDIVGNNDIEALARAREEARKAGLEADPEFYSMPLLDLYALIGRGGGGPGKVGDILISDVILWLDFHPCFAIHDFDYIKKLTKEERTAKDLRLLRNMKAWNALKSNPILMHWLRARVIKGYYAGVRVGGCGYEG